MARERSGQVFERFNWFAVVDYLDSNGKKQRVDKQVGSKRQAEAVAQRLLEKVRASNGKKLKAEATIDQKSMGWYARVTYVDEQGKRHDIWRKGENKSDAKQILKDLLRDLDDHGERSIEASQMTFKYLADFYEKTYLVEPEYIDGRKVAGLRNQYDFKLRLDTLKGFFGNRKLRSITHGDLERFKAVRLKTPVILGKNRKQVEREKKVEPKTRQRSIATVHRELSLLRRVLNIAVRNGWINRNPFYMGDSLIKPGDEKPRERILTRDEEAKLIAACAGPREHLRPIIITALDTGMRRGEMLKLKWADIDFENNIITVRAFNTKTMRERQVAMTGRLTIELQALYEKSTKDPNVLVFGITDNVKKSFSAVRREAELPDVRLHDLRHTHATRLVGAHMPLSEVGRILGHTQANTTYRYVNANVDTARRAAAMLDEFNKSAVKVDAENQTIH